MTDVINRGPIGRPACGGVTETNERARPDGRWGPFGRPGWGPIGCSRPWWMMSSGEFPTRLREVIVPRPSSLPLTPLGVPSTG